MKKISIAKLFFIAALSVSLFFRQSTPTYAASCVNWDIVFNGPNPPSSISVGSISSYDVAIRGGTLTNGDTYTLLFRNSGGGGPIELGTDVVSGNAARFTVDHPSVISETGPKTLQIQRPDGQVCELWDYNVSATLTCDGVSLTQAGVNNASCIDNKSGTISVVVSGLQQGGQPYNDNIFIEVLEGNLVKRSSTSQANNGSVTLDVDPSSWGGGNNYSVKVWTEIKGGSPICQKPFTLSEIACDDEAREPTTGSNEAASFELCDQILDSNLQAQCQQCAIEGEGGDAGQGGVWTAVGCISRNPVNIAERLIQVGLGMGGGVALIMTLAGGFILSTSQGDPQKANQAKEMITNSVIGLLFVIFSVVILQFIGVTILRIPGFGADTEQVD